MRNFAVQFTENDSKRIVDVYVNIVDDNKLFTITAIKCNEEDIFNSHFNYKVGDVVLFEDLIQHFMSDNFYEDVKLYDCGVEVTDLKIDILRRELGKLVDVHVFCEIDDTDPDNPTYIYIFNTSDDRIEKDYILFDVDNDDDVGSFVVDDSTLGGVSIEIKAGEDKVAYDESYKIYVDEDDLNPWNCRMVYKIAKVSKEDYISINTNKLDFTGVDFSKAVVRNMDASFVDGDDGSLTNEGDGIYTIKPDSNYDVTKSNIIQLCFDDGHIMCIEVSKKK